jgi:hypothetical protein
MSLSLEKLDARHALFPHYSHRVKYSGDQKQYVITRNWLWESYGPGLERELWYVTCYEEVAVPEWAWHTDGRTNFLYLKDALVTHFSLKYLNT